MVFCFIEIKEWLHNPVSPEKIGKNPDGGYGEEKLLNTSFIFSWHHRPGQGGILWSAYQWGTL